MSARRSAGYMISVVADTFQVHPQTLRLYERLGFVKTGEQGLYFEMTWTPQGTTSQI